MFDEENVIQAPMQMNKISPLSYQQCDDHELSASKLRTLLYITALYPPTQNAAALRSGAMVKYMPSFGWRPIVLTCTSTDSGAVEIDESGSREVHRIVASEIGRQVLVRCSGKFMSIMKNNHHVSVDNHDKEMNKSTFNLFARALNTATMFLEDPQGWIAPAVKTGLEICRSRKVDAIFSSFPPTKSHIIASKIHKKTGIPWIAEYRDPWSDNQYVDRMWPFNRLDSYHEQRVLRDASLIVTVSPGLSERISKKLVKKAVTIYNGFDEDDYMHQNSDASNVFSITYTGEIYPGKRDPSILIEAVIELISEGRIRQDEISLRFFGRNVKGSLDQSCSKLSDSLLHLNGPISHSESIAAQHNSTVLLLLSWDDPRDAPTLTTKIFEYLVAGKPILAIAHRGGDIARLLKETGTGVVINTPSDAKEVLSKWFDEINQMGRIKSYYNPDSRAISNYSRRIQCGKLVQAIETLLS